MPAEKTAFFTLIAEILAPQNFTGAEAESMNAGMTRAHVIGIVGRQVGNTDKKG